MDKKKDSKKEAFLKIPGVEEKLKSIAKRGGFTVDQLLNVIEKESGFNPSIKNAKGSGATGLIQFMPNTAKDLGTTTDALASMGVLEQLDFVDKYFEKNHNKGSNPYFTVAYPKAGRMGPDEIIGKKGSKIAEQNPGWVDANGNVTPRSILKFGDPKAKSGNTELDKITNNVPSKEIPPNDALDKAIADGKVNEANIATVLSGDKEGIAKINAEEKAIIDKAIADKKSVKLQQIKDQISAKANKEDLASFDKKFAKFNDSFSTPEKIKGNGFAYDKKDFGAKLPIEALASGALGLIGLSQTDVKIPKDESKVSQATLAYLNETKRLSQIGLPPEMEARAKDSLKESTKVGIENLTRASGGNRNLILANLGGLDTARAKGISALAIADQQAKDAAFAEYGKTLQQIDEFQRSKDRYNLQIDDREAQRKRQSGENLSNAAFSKMMDDIQYQRENGPGSANDMYKKQIMYEMFGQVHGMKDDGKGTTKGTKSYKEAQDRKTAKFNTQVEQVVAEKDRVTGIYNRLNQQEKIALQRGGFDPSQVDSKTIQNKQDLMSQYIESYQPPEGFTPTEVKPYDGDTFKDQFGVSNRMTGFGNQSFDAREKNQPGGTGLNWWDAYNDNGKVSKVIGKGPYGRNITELGVQADGRTYDSAFLQNKFDPVNFTDIGGPKTLEQIMASNHNPYLGDLTPEQFRNKQ